MASQPDNELIELCQRLLDSIDQQDWATYTELCSPHLTAFEAEAAGHLVVGMPFHRFYFDMEATGRPKQSSISSPLVQSFGDTAVVTYVRMVQLIDEHGQPKTLTFDETRVWHRADGVWQHVHFHRSDGGSW